MNNVTNSATSSAISIPKESPNSLGANSLIPVTLQTTGKGIYTCIAGQQYQINSATKLPIQQLNFAHSLLLNIVHSLTGTSQTQLFALGQTYQLALPAQIVIKMSHNLEQAKRLQQLAKRKEGYRLPNATLSHNQLIFANGSKIEVESLQTLAQGEYVVSIAHQAQQFTLKLSPIQLRQTVTLTRQGEEQNLDIDSANKADNGNHQAPSSDGDKVSLKTNINYQYSALNRHLESIPLPDDYNENPIGEAKKDPSLSKETVFNNKICKPNQLNKLDSKPKSLSANENTLVKAPSSALLGALQKAGGLPTSTAKVQPIKDSIASALFKALPALKPLPLTDLAMPHQVKQAINDCNALPLSPNNWEHARLDTHSNSIVLLLQLLLAKGAHNNVSAELKLKINQLHTHLGLPTPLMCLLESAAAMPLLADLVNNLALYQQASDNSEQANQYYFAIPYSINHYQEQIEGHISKTHDDKHKDGETWNIQLKFNLSSGDLLIKAKVNIQPNTLTHTGCKVSSQVKKQTPLNLSFMSNSHSLINKISILTPALTIKMAALGFNNVNIKTHCEQIPISLFPNENYLVKVQV
ncbi:hypothetical protein AB4298_17720 [Shewanella sp. 10N.261.52.F9]|uniref:hypothetical protein n=1 Tax=Shewanella sp. 10N.261.52.F9 TaxID=3229684 RepID=UPI00354E3683